MRIRTLIALLAAAMLTTSQAWGAAARDLQADTITNNTSGSPHLGVPTAGTNLVSDTSTDTLQNKTISGSSNTLTNLPTSGLSGQVSVSNGGTGLSSVSSNGIVYGQGTSAMGVASAGTQYQIFQAGSSGVPAFDAVHLDQSAAVTGILPFANGGIGVNSFTSGALLLGACTSHPTALAGSSSGDVATWNGSAWVASAPVAAMPALNGSQASPQSVTASGGISLSSIGYVNVAFIAASTSGTTTVTATPSITACTAAGQTLVIIGESATNLVLLQDNAGLSGSGLQLNGDWTSGLNNSLSLMCDGNSNWVETARR